MYTMFQQPSNHSPNGATSTNRNGDEMCLFLLAIRIISNLILFYLFKMFKTHYLPFVFGWQSHMAIYGVSCIFSNQTKKNRFVNVIGSTQKTEISIPHYYKI